MPKMNPLPTLDGGEMRKVGVGDRWWVSICIMYRNIYNLEIFAGCKISNHPANFDWSVEREQVEILKSLRF